MQYIVYISSASKEMEQDELLNILTISRRNNRARSLTGMLLYGEGTFIQVLEGESQDLEPAYEIITKDPRHKNIIKMAHGELAERNFPEWAMGFKSVNAGELAEFSGYINPAGKPFLHQSDSNDVIVLLQTFADLNRM